MTRYLPQRGVPAGPPLDATSERNMLILQMLQHTARRTRQLEEQQLMTIPREDLEGLQFPGEEPEATPGKDIESGTP